MCIYIYIYIYICVDIFLGRMPNCRRETPARWERPDLAKRNNVYNTIDSKVMTYNDRPVMTYNIIYYTILYYNII